ncbi:MAG: hypothetical protein LC751_19365 [Actinobacteria bacterium]|nr:hypothetical protein [Actinomycetota bacterium]
MGGLPFPQYAWRYIFDATQRGGKIMRAKEDAKSAKRTPSSEECIRDALETFSKKQWIPLIAEFEREDLDPLRDYLDANRAEFERGPSWKKKYEGVLARTIERNIVLVLGTPNLQVTYVTDPMWAATWHQHSRIKALEGAPRPSRRRSWMEMGSKRAIAESLSQQGHKVDRREVSKWFERMEREPFKEFDGDSYEYWLKISDPKAYERHRERLRRAGGRDEG